MGIGVTSAGALYYFRAGPQPSASDIHVASYDFGTGKLLSSPKTIAEPSRSLSMPAWSPDGKYLAYISQPANGPVDKITIRSMDTGQSRYLYPENRNIQVLNLSESIQWSPDGRSFLTANGRISRVDAQTGEATTIVSGVGQAVNPRWSTDGTSIYYRQQNRGGVPGVSHVVRDLASGNERELIRRNELDSVFLSPDGRYIATTSRDQVAKTNTVLLIPTAGGEAREVLRVNLDARGPIMSWARDSRSFLYRSTVPKELWQIPIEGTPKNLGPTSGEIPPYPAAHPDGRQIAYAAYPPIQADAGEPGVWVMENFLSKLTTGK